MFGYLKRALGLVLRDFVSEEIAHAVQSPKDGSEEVRSVSQWVRHLVNVP